MITPRAPYRKSLVYGLLVLIFVVTAGLRLNNLRFGLPSLWDPDEPIFMIKAVEMLSSGSLNPKWFGHPGSTTIYLIAAVDALTVGWARLTGAYPTTEQFIRAAYADPSLLFVPARTAMAMLGVIAVGLTFLVGRRLSGSAVGLIAAAFLAINPLHIAWSQVVRTDVHASVFMLAALFFAIGGARDGRLRDFALAGLFTGFAIATKWPAVVIFVAVIGASVHGFRSRRDGKARTARNFGAAVLATILGLFCASPFLFLDFPTVLANVTNEVKVGHLAQNGGGFGENLWWYLRAQAAGSMGWIGLLLAALGAGLMTVRDPVGRATIVPATAAFLFLISSQDIIYSRWLVPALPFLCIFAAHALNWCAALLAARLRLSDQRALLGVLTMLALVPSASNAAATAVERANDTRGQAARWARSHIPAGSTVLIEHLEFSLRDQPWTFLFPLGTAGCVDGEKLLQNDVRFEDVEQIRSGAPIVDIGNVPASRRESCRADFAILTYYDLYRAEASRYPAELATYRALLTGGKTVAFFAPQPGRSGGPKVRIVALPRPSNNLQGSK